MGRDRSHTVGSLRPPAPTSGSARATSINRDGKTHRHGGTSAPPSLLTTTSGGLLKQPYKQKLPNVAQKSDHLLSLRGEMLSLAIKRASPHFHSNGARTRPDRCPSASAPAGAFCFMPSKGNDEVTPFTVWYRESCTIAGRRENICILEHQAGCVLSSCSLQATTYGPSGPSLVAMAPWAKDGVVAETRAIRKGCPHRSSTRQIMLTVFMPNNSESDRQ
jgi:hypothetical protein